MPTVGTVSAWAVEAVRSLSHARVALNRANVFPVADSDTGTNMLLTFQQGLDELHSTDCADDVLVALRAVARGAVIGARGNSGSILAEYLRGFVRGVRNSVVDEGLQEVIADDQVMHRISVVAFVDGLSTAASAARHAVGDPAPGTILAAAKGAADAAEDFIADSRSPRGTASSNGSLPDLDQVLDAAIAAARLAVTRGTDQLAALHHAQVVDSGAVGLVLVLQALVDVLRGEEGNELPAVDLQAATWRAKLSDRDAVHSAPYDHEQLHDHHEGTDLANRFELMCLAKPPGSLSIDAAGQHGVAAGTSSTDPSPADPSTAKNDATTAASRSKPQHTDDRVRAALQDLGESVVVIGSESTGGQAMPGQESGELRIHIHTSDPAAVLRYFAGWQLSHVVVHQVQAPFPDRTWSWVGVTRSPGLLSHIAVAGGIGLLAQAGDVDTDELIRAVTDANNADVFVIQGDVAPHLVGEDWQMRIAAAGHATDKTLLNVSSDPAFFTDVHLATISAHIQMHAHESTDDVLTALRTAVATVRLATDAAQLERALGFAADVVVIVRDDAAPADEFEALAAIAHDHDVEVVTLDSAVDGSRLLVGVEGTL